MLIPAAALAYAAPIIVASGLIGTTLGFLANVNQLTLRLRFMYWGTIPAGSAIGSVGPLLPEPA